MRLIALAAASVLLAGASFAGPIEGMNIALVHDDREVAATTTLEDGGAELQAQDDGEFGLRMQSTLPEPARLIAMVRREIWSADLPAGPPQRDWALSVPALTGDLITLCLITLEGAGALPPPDAETFVCASETTTDAGHSGVDPDDFVSDLNPALPAPPDVTPAATPE